MIIIEYSINGIYLRTTWFYYVDTNTVFTGRKYLIKIYPVFIFIIFINNIFYTLNKNRICNNY